jgi:hypothetical protein
MPELWDMLVGSPGHLAAVVFGALVALGILWSTLSGRARASRFARELAVHERLLAPLGYTISPSEHGLQTYDAEPPSPGWPTISRFESGTYRCEVDSARINEALQLSLWFSRPPHDGRTMLDELENKADLEPALMVLMAGVLPRLLAFAEDTCAREDVVGYVGVGHSVGIEWDYRGMALGSAPLYTEDVVELVEAVRGVVQVVDGLEARAPLTPTELLEVAQGDDRVAALMAAKLLLSRHAGSPEARDLFGRILADSRYPERYRLLGWAVDPRVVEELGEDEVLGRRVMAIKSCTPQDAWPLCEDLFARHTPGEVAAAMDLGDPSERGWSSNAPVANALVWHALDGGYGVEVARGWIAAFMPHMSWPHGEFLRSAAASGDEVFARVAGIAGPDALATAWTERLDEVWDDAFVARLPEVLSTGNLGPRAATTLAQAVARREIVGAIIPAIGALQQVGSGYLDLRERRAVDALVEELLALRDAYGGGDGGLTLVSAGAEGGLEVARAEAGGLEVTLDLGEGAEEEEGAEAASAQVKP